MQFTKYYQCDVIEESKMGETSGLRNAYSILVGKREEIDYFEDPSLDEKTVLTH